MKFLLFSAVLVFCACVQAQEVAVQTIPNYGDSIPETTWFEAPIPDLRVIWSSRQSTKTFNWADLRGGKPIQIQSLTTPTGFFAWKFSPDVSQVLGRFSTAIGEVTGDRGSGHNSRVFDFSTRRFRFVADRLYEPSETWAPDGKRVAFLRGTTDYTVGNQEPVRLMVRELASGRETLLRTDNNMHRLRWTKSGDLLVTSYTNSLNGPDLHDFTLSFRGGKSKAKQVVPPEYFPLSPDGKLRLDFSPARPKTPVPGLYLSDARGENRRLVAPSSSLQGYRALHWAHDSKTAWIVTQDEIGEEETPTSPAKDTIRLRFYQVNAKTGTLTLTGETQAVQQGAAIVGESRSGPGELFLSNYQELGFSRDGQWFFFRRSEWKHESPVTIELQAAALHAVRLSDGQLFPVAVFQGEFAIAPLG